MWHYNLYRVEYSWIKLTRSGRDWEKPRNPSDYSIIVVQPLVFVIMLILVTAWLIRTSTICSFIHPTDAFFQYSDQWDTSDFIHGCLFAENLISVVPLKGNRWTGPCSQTVLLSFPGRRWGSTGHRGLRGGENSELCSIMNFGQASTKTSHAMFSLTES